MHAIESCPQPLSECTHLSVLDQVQNLPLLIEWKDSSSSPPGPDAFLKLWTSSRAWLDSQLLHHGALLFRGFGILGQEFFQSIISGMHQTPFQYVAGNSPRVKLADGIYSSTEYPPQYFISLHNELSYTPHWPQRIFFCCLIEPSEGGETPLVSSRVLLQALPQDLVAEFRTKKIKYIRNLHGGKGLGKSWQESFETQDPSILEHHATASGMTVRWNADASATLTSIGQATAVHPLTGEEVWFNQADQFHPSTLPPQLYKSLMAIYQSEDFLPQNATFGDGTLIPLEYLDTIRQATQRQIVSTPWRKGDLLIVDNMLVAHGRMPFKGPRKILVSMFGAPN